MSGGIHLQPELEQIWRYTWMPKSSEIRDAFRDRDRACSEMDFEAMIMRTWRP